MASLCLTTAYGQDEWELRIIGGMFTPGQAQAVANYEYYALVADMEQGLNIYDISTAGWPVFVGSFFNDGWVNDLVIRDNLAYLANWNSGVTILDITNPAIPEPLSAFNTPGTTTDIYLSGDLLFAADFFNGLVILDIANPGNITQGGFISSLSFGSVAVDDTIIYISELGSGIQIYSIADTANPVFKSMMPLATDCNDILLHDHYMYLACGQAGMLVYDIANNLNPVGISSYNTSGSLSRIAIADTIAYLADGEGGLTALNVTDPAYPFLIQTLPTPGTANGVAFFNDFTLVADGSMLLVVYHDEYLDIDEVEPATPSDFSIVNCYPNPFNASTTVKFSLTYGSQISMDIYDLRGRHIANLTNGYYEPGEHSIRWNASPMASGMYFIKISDNRAGIDGSQSAVARVLYLK